VDCRCSQGDDDSPPKSRQLSSHLSPQTTLWQEPARPAVPAPRQRWGQRHAEGLSGRSLSALREAGHRWPRERRARARR